MELKDDCSEKIYYNFKNYQIYVRKGLLSSYRDYAAPSHWHDDIEFISVLNGEMQYNVNGEIITLSKGQGIFVNSKALHFGFSDSHKECEFICILLHPIMLCSSAEIERDFVFPVLTNPNISFIKLQKNIEWQQFILDCINQIYQSKNKTSAPLIVSGLFFQIWAQIFENNPLDLPDRQNDDLIIIKNIIGFIQKNYDKKISLNKIACAGYVGQSKCCKIFKKYIGQSPNDYLTQYRLNKCLQLLQNTDMSITEIALSSGFNGNSYFAETFKKNYGKTPSDIRKDSKRIENRQWSQNAISAKT